MSLWNFVKNRSGIFHIHRRHMSLSLTLILTQPAHHTSSTYLTLPTVSRMFVKDVHAEYWKNTLPQKSADFLADRDTLHICDTATTRHSYCLITFVSKQHYWQKCF